VIAGPDGALSAVRPGAIIINTSTVSPGLSRRLSEAALVQGAWILERPPETGESCK
jgi:3-hydroxyisobutyrate dehydrogenase-like beta-hydroxyacid dehydrogenase